MGRLSVVTNETSVWADRPKARAEVPRAYTTDPAGATRRWVATRAYEAWHRNQALTRLQGLAAAYRFTVLGTKMTWPSEAHAKTLRVYIRTRSGRERVLRWSDANQDFLIVHAWSDTVPVVSELR